MKIGSYYMKIENYSLIWLRERLSDYKDWRLEAGNFLSKMPVSFGIDFFWEKRLKNYFNKGVLPSNAIWLLIHTMEEFELATKLNENK